MIRCSLAPSSRSRRLNYVLLKFVSAYHGIPDRLWFATDICDVPRSSRGCGGCNGDVSASDGYLARRDDAVGKRSTFEIHHVQEIAKDGSVYDIENMMVLTPKCHIDIQKGNSYGI